MSGVTKPDPAKHPRPAYRQGTEPRLILHQPIRQKADANPSQHQRHHQPLALGLGHQIEGKPVTGQQTYSLLMGLTGWALNKIIMLQLGQLDFLAAGQGMVDRHAEHVILFPERQKDLVLPAQRVQRQPTVG